MAFVTMLKPEERKEANINTVKMLLTNAEFRLHHNDVYAEDRADLLDEIVFYRELYDELLMSPENVL